MPAGMSRATDSACHPVAGACRNPCPAPVPSAARQLLRQDKAEFEQARRAEGFGDFRIWPTGAREHYFSVDYVEPLFRHQSQKRSAMTAVLSRYVVGGNAAMRQPTAKWR